MRVFELFAGIGSPIAALKRAGVLHQSVGFSEIDKYAIKSYCAVHGESDLMNYGDITKIKELPPTDLLFHGSPCQDFSVAGKGRGGDEDSGTRSSLMWETVRLITKAKPKYVVWENVKGSISQKNRHNFEKYLSAMNDLGYNNYWKVLNTKDYGVPQNRERVFVVSILKSSDNGAFSFPKAFDNGIRLKHVLEQNVDEKYYISDEKCAKLLSQLRDLPANGMQSIGNTNPSGKGMNGNVWAGDMRPTLTTNKGEGMKIVVPCLTPDRLEKRQNGRRFKEDGEPMFSITTQDRHGVLLGVCEEGVVVRVANKQGYQIAAPGDSIVFDECPCLKSERLGLMVTEPKIIDDQGRTTKKLTPKDYCPTLRAQDHGNPPKVMEPNEIQMFELSQTVSVRKYEVDIKNLQILLRSSKEQSGVSNKRIAEMMGLPLTHVEHWFRTDQSFSIPDVECWPKLKETLSITTNEFDESIMEFVEKDGVYEKANRIYMVDGISPTITVASADEKILEPNEMIFVGSLEHYGNDQMNRVYSDKGIAPTITCPTGGGREQKVYTKYRIRKLTPKECWRLQGFSDDDFSKAELVNSNSQLYKQAGNSITVDVLVYIFKQLFEPQEKVFEVGEQLSIL